MVETAQVLDKGIKDKTIVLLKAIIPYNQKVLMLSYFYQMELNYEWQNFQWNNVKKNKGLGEFQTLKQLSPPTSD